MPPLAVRAGDAVIEVDPDVGGRLVSWRIGALELLGGRSDNPVEYGCYPMAPWPGRLRENEVVVAGAHSPLPPTYDGWALHGTVLDRVWRVVDVGASHVMVATELGASWPWPGRAVLSWHLAADALHSELAITTDGAPFPAEIGWHPWFRRRLNVGQPLTWDLDAQFIQERGPDMLPTGRLLDPGTLAGPFDHAFAVPDGRATILWPGALELVVESDCGWFVVFDELDDLVCVEPQTAAPGSLRTDRGMVSAGAPRTATVDWRWRRLAPAR